MNGALETVKQAANENIDKRIVVSSALGAFVSGAIVYFAAKSGIKVLTKAAKVAKGGK